MKKWVVFIIVFGLSLIQAWPSVVKFIKRDYQAAQIFSSNPFETAIKTVILRNYPEWKPIESELEKQIPNSSANVSVSTYYGAARKTLELRVSLVVNKKLTDMQLGEAKNVICRILKTYDTNYDTVVLTALDLKSYSEKRSVDCN